MHTWTPVLWATWWQAHHLHRMRTTCLVLWLLLQRGHIYCGPFSAVVESSRFHVSSSDPSSFLAGTKDFWKKEQNTASVSRSILLTSQLFWFWPHTWFCVFPGTCSRRSICYPVKLCGLQLSKATIVRLRLDIWCWFNTQYQKRIRTVVDDPMLTLWRLLTWLRAIWGFHDNF